VLVSISGKWVWLASARLSRSLLAAVLEHTMQGDSDGDITQAEHGHNRACRAHDERGPLFGLPDGTAVLISAHSRPGRQSGPSASPSSSRFPRPQSQTCNPDNPPAAKSVMP
jgi:hypothetical protein